MAASKRVTNARSGKFHQLVHKRGAVEVEKVSIRTRHYGSAGALSPSLARLDRPVFFEACCSTFHLARREQPTAAQTTQRHGVALSVLNRHELYPEGSVEGQGGRGLVVPLVGPSNPPFSPLLPTIHPQKEKSSVNSIILGFFLFVVVGSGARWFFPARARCPSVACALRLWVGCACATRPLVPSSQ